MPRPKTDDYYDPEAAQAEEDRKAQLALMDGGDRAEPPSGRSPGVEENSVYAPVAPAAPAAPAASGDPVTDAIMAAFTKKGLTPNASDVPYWSRRIAETGGWDNAGNQSYWLERMARERGGVGDYLERPENIPTPANVGGSSLGTALAGQAVQAGSAPSVPSSIQAAGQPVAQKDPNDDVYNQILMAMMKLDPTKVSINDPALKNQSDTYRAGAERSRRDQQSALAEMYGAQGMSGSGALAGDINSGFESMSQDVAGHDASLVAGEIEAERDQVKNALEMYGTNMNADQQRQLQQRLGELDAAVQREKTGSSERVAMRGLDLNDAQFDKNLAFNTGKTQAELDQEAIRILLGQ